MLRERENQTVRRSLCIRGDDRRRKNSFLLSLFLSLLVRFVADNLHAKVVVTQSTPPGSLHDTK